MILEPPVWITDILEQHVEDLDVLWSQRRINGASSEFTRKAFVRLDARILAHLDALVLARDEAHPLLFPALMAGYGAALTATLALLLADAARHGPRIISAFKAAAGPVLEGIAQGLAWTAPLGSLKEPLLAIAKQGATPQAIAAIGVLAWHNQFRPGDAPLDAMLTNADPAIRTAAWRAAANLAVPRPPLAYHNGINDADAVVRSTAIHAASWAAHKPLLDVCRGAAQRPTATAIPLLNIFAVISGPEDVPVLGRLAGADALGPARFDIMARSGFPAMAPLLLTAMKNKDAAVASAAGLAFRVLTHFDPTDGTRVTLKISDDPIEQAFAPEVPVPDVAAADEFWKKQGNSLSALPRITRAMPVDPALPPNPASLPQLDCRGHLDIHLRHAFLTGAPKRPGELLAFSTTPA